MEQFAAEGVSGGSSGHVTVLVVEDEGLVRDMIARELADVGYRVLESETADEAASLLEREHIDLLLTDIRMPGHLDGWDLAERMRVKRPDVPVIYATGYSREEARPVSNSTLIQKPYRLVDLVDAVGRLLARDDGPRS